MGFFEDNSPPTQDTDRATGQGYTPPPGGYKGYNPNRGQQTTPQPTPQPAQSSVGHNGTTAGGMNREAYRDAWQSSGARSMDDLKAFIAKNGGTLDSDNGTVVTPFGEKIDMLQNARGSANGQGQASAAWNGIGGDSGGTGGGMSGGNMGSGGGFAGGNMGGEFGGANGGFAYSQYGLQAPTQVNPGTITPQVAQTQTAEAAQAQTQTAQAADPMQAAQVQPVERIQAPDALAARSVADPTGYQGLSRAQLEADPSYQFRLSQGLGAIENGAAARGNLLTGGVQKGLQDYAQQFASQEYGAADSRARQTYNDTLSQQAGVIGQNNAAQANGYGLTNQYGQQAALANQANAYNTGATNAQFAQQAGLANQGNQQQTNLFNAQSGNQGNQFNASNRQQTALANAGYGNAGNQFNAGMNYNAQVGNIGNQMAGVGQNNAANLAYGNYGLNAYNANVNAELGRGNLGVSQGQLALGQNTYGLNVNNSNFDNGLRLRQQTWNESQPPANSGNG